MRTVVRGGRVVTASAVVDVDVLIDDGVIAAIGSLPELEADAVIDARGRLVLPGGVDVHTHFSTPYDGGMTDDFHAGTIASLVGGTTTIINFALPMREDLEE